MGLMSGTSADGIDVAIVDLPKDGEWKLLGFHEQPFPPDLRRQILDLGRPETGHVDAICRMDAVLGEWLASAALEACQRFDIPIEEIDLIGSHGQTIHHLPEPVEAHGFTTRSTLQIGNPSVIAERTGVTTVADFRSRDMAAGGQGAPLVPLVDYELFRSADRSRALINIGGIANLTLIPANADPQGVVAFDTGPGNVVMDGLMSALTAGAETFDRDGATARAGKAQESLLADLLTHSYFRLAPPKSTGPEEFGKPVVDRMVAGRREATDADLIRTAAALTARSIAGAIASASAGPVDDVVVSGGGAKNPFLLKLLAESMRKEGLSGEVLTSESLGILPEAKEAVAFAFLALRCVEGLPGTLPGSTGASHPVVLGCVAPGRRTRIVVDL